MVDPSPTAKRHAQQAGLPLFASLAELFAADKPDGVILATPNQLHVPHAMACIEVGLPMLLEKPIAPTVGEAEALDSAAVQARIVGRTRGVRLMQTARRWMLALVFSLVGACAVQPDRDSRVPSRRDLGEGDEYSQCVERLHGQWWQRTELFFGRNSPAGVIPEADFQSFLDNVVTPLFPDGLTVIDGIGQFRASGASAPEKEDSKLLILLYAFDQRQSDSVEEIRRRYKERFRQQSVLRVDRRSCVSF